MKNKLIIVSNRLPVTVSKDDDEGFKLDKSVGGLATGLSSFYKEKDGLWIGWPGIENSEIDEKDKKEIAKLLEKEKCKPVFVDDDEFKQFYFGFSNDTIWPLFHYFTRYTVFEQSSWESYKKVNEIFADEVVKYAKPGDKIWVQDYHFLLLPKMIKDRMPDVSIGFFLHIPFPSSEIFRQLPWREELLYGMLGADLLGFHTYDYVRHFESAVRRIIGFEHTYGKIRTGNTLVNVDAFPIGIDFNKFHDSPDNPSVLKEALKFKNMPEGRKIILSIDRLDYTKGIPERLRAFDRFLEKYPEYHDKVNMIMLSSPSRTEVETYRKLKEDVDQLVGSINGKYGNVGWIPVNYLYRSVPFEIVGALYTIADTCMVTPLRDGMNLVAKEFVAAKSKKPGVLILSETAGAAQELSEAIIVNPNNRDEIADAIKQALEMPKKEQLTRIKTMQKRIKRYDIHHWAKDFMNKLEEAKEEQKKLLSKAVTNVISKEITGNFKKAKKRLFLLDYDGTLVNFVNNPNDAKPDQELYEIIKKLKADPKNKIYIISGRERDSLERWWKEHEIGIIGEHGVWIRETGGDWRTLFKIHNEWKKEIYHIFELFTDRTPGAFTEEKDYSLVWHFRNVNHTMAHVRVNELKDVLLNYTHNLNLGVMEGNKILEIKDLNITKGNAAMSVIDDYKPDFILCIGDDLTDEYMFRELPEEAFTVRVGFQPSYAKFNLKNVEEVRSFLNKFVK